ncbi:hypothetical protein AABB24_015593, partial [Solanum stoloniferum]
FEQLLLLFLISFTTTLYYYSIPKMSDKESSPIINNLMEMNEEALKNLSWNKSDLYQWEGFWCNPSIMKAAMDLKATFKSYPNDVLLASSMKTGSTWLKAICVCIMQGN